MALEMARIRIIGMKPDLPNAMLALREKGYVQIDDVSEVSDSGVKPFALEEKYRQERQKLEEMLSKIEGFQEVLGCQVATPPEQYPGEYFETARAGIEALSPLVEGLAARREKLETEEASLPCYAATLEKLIPEIPDSARNKKNRTVGVIVKQQNLNILEILRTQISELSHGRAEMTTRKIDEETHGMLIIFPGEFSKDVESLLGEKDVSRFRLPDEFTRESPDALLMAILGRVNAIPQEFRQLDEERERLQETWYARLNDWAEAMREDLQMVEMFSRLGETETTFVLLGWTPVKKPVRVETNPGRGSRVFYFVEELPIMDEIRERAPVILENPRPVQPFERLVHLLASPTYEGMDPTWLVAVFLPILFGMILGDAGYGAILLGLCLLLLRRFKSGFSADLLKILAYGSGWSIVFGIL